MSFTKRLGIEERFRRYFKEGGSDECWQWEGARSVDGYGRLGAGGRTNRKIAAHRIAWELANGKKIPDGMHCLHRCDNPPCVNPAHLFLGTNLDNMRDRNRKGRCRARGTPGMHAKLTPEQVIEIRKREDTQKNLAKKFGVSRGAVASVQCGKNWKWLATMKGTKP